MKTATAAASSWRAGDTREFSNGLNVLMSAPVGLLHYACVALSMPISLLGYPTGRSGSNASPYNRLKYNELMFLMFEKTTGAHLLSLAAMLEHTFKVISDHVSSYWYLWSDMG